MTAPLVLTPGEPAGIGPEITASAWEALRKNPSQNFFVLTDAAYFSARLPHIPAQIQFCIGPCLCLRKLES
jgi:4-hydroxythreonine-4-phosphate dehydrogenase